MANFIRKKQPFTYNRGAMARGGNKIIHSKCNWKDVPVLPNWMQIWAGLVDQIRVVEAKKKLERDKKREQVSYLNRAKKNAMNKKRREAAAKKGGVGYEPRPTRQKLRGTYPERAGHGL